jgi:ribonucleoside-triphosphate reductase
MIGDQGKALEILSRGELMALEAAEGALPQAIVEAVRQRACPAAPSAQTSLLPGRWRVRCAGMAGGELIGQGVKFQRIRRITGYLVGTLDRFNDAKRAEERERVRHGTGGMPDA